MSYFELRHAKREVCEICAKVACYRPCTSRNGPFVANGHICHSGPCGVTSEQVPGKETLKPVGNVQKHVRFSEVCWEMWLLNMQEHSSLHREYLPYQEGLFCERSKR